ncbi:hypothetical protein NRB20_64800 [Nocardia sp. RB20]|uniref:Uncharacterized protein n=1 Tax=Nocardia macrotermitis TaxID=2585198 RepID=A0A7K0DDG6_9NOCA|nr:hypothetical protein [Nocardia macrotermitis]
MTAATAHRIARITLQLVHALIATAITLLLVYLLLHTR